MAGDIVVSLVDVELLTIRLRCSLLDKEGLSAVRAAGLAAAAGPVPSAFGKLAGSLGGNGSESSGGPTAAEVDRVEAAVRSHEQRRIPTWATTRRRARAAGGDRRPRDC